MTDFKDFKGAGKRIEDIDLPRLAQRIGVGEDELHAIIDVETSGTGFDKQGRPKMLFEPHVFYRNLSGAKRTAAVNAGLAYAKWDKAKKYPADSYPRLKKALLIDETAALRACSWGLGQVLGENHRMVGYETPQAMVLAFMEDEEEHLEAMVEFIIASGIEDDMRKLAALDRKTLPSDCEPIVKVYNGPSYKANNYHVKMANAHNKWRAIRDTPLPDSAPVLPVNDEKLVSNVQQLLRDKGYPEIGEPDGIYGPRTRNAILAFQADQKLPLTGVITDDLLAALVKAEVRENALERETATADDLKEHTTVKDADWLKKLGMAVIGMSGIGGLLDGTASVDSLTTGLNGIGKVAGAIGSLSPWVIMAAVGGAGLYLGNRIIRARVEAYRQGRLL